MGLAFLVGALIVGGYAVYSGAVERALQTEKVARSKPPTPAGTNNAAVSQPPTPAGKLLHNIGSIGKQFGVDVEGIVNQVPPAKVNWSRPWTPQFFLLAMNTGEILYEGRPPQTADGKIPSWLEPLYGEITKGAVDNASRRVGVNREKANTWARTGNKKLIPARFGNKNRQKMALHMRTYIERNGGFES